MSNNSWKQYGGISKMDEFNVINASTVIAEQFVSRSTKPIYQYLNGTFEVSLDLSAGINIMAGNSIYADVDLFVNKNIHSNNKIFFGGNSFTNSGNTFPTVANDSTHAFLYGDVNYVGINTTSPKTIFNITGTIDSETDILTVESGNAYIRNIIGQNNNQKGIVIDASNDNANIFFHIDNSTNELNTPDASIRYSAGGYLNTSTTTGIHSSSNYHQIDTSGGTIYMDRMKTQVDSSGSIIMNTSGGFILDTSYSYTHIDSKTGDIKTDTSGQYILHSSGGYFLLNQDNGLLSSSGNILINSSGGLVEIDSAGGEIRFNSGQVNLNTLLDFTPVGRGLSGELYNETLTVYDNDNSTFLHNVYNNTNILTGSSIVGIGKDPSANTFMRLVPATSLQGSAYGGGLYPHDTSRSMNMVGLNDICGNFIANQITVEGNNKAKYTSTVGFNTFMPKTEQYVVDINGPTRIANGEINTIAELDFELRTISFSKTHPDYGIAVGTPSTLINDNSDELGNQSLYEQYAYYTNNGGKTWGKSDIYKNSSAEALEVIFSNAFMYDLSYGFISGNFSIMFYTNDGGINWYRMQNNDDIYRESGAFEIVEFDDKLRFFIPYAYNDALTDTINDKTAQIRIFDISLSNIDTSLNSITYPINDFFEVGLNTNITCASTIEEYVYIAGNGVGRYQVSALEDNASSYSEAQVYTLNTDFSYNSIHAYDINNVVAVGPNIISYISAGSSWNHIDISENTLLGHDISLNAVYMHSDKDIIALGDNGVFLYTINGPSTANWQVMPDEILNSSGMAQRINGSENTLITATMTDNNSFIIGDVITKSSNQVLDADDVVGFSKIQYIHLPSLFHNNENKVLDICGNMDITGSIQVIDGNMNVGTINHRSATDISGTLNIGTSSLVTNIGKTDSRSIIENAISKKFNDSVSVINIGAHDCLATNDSVLINIGNYRPTSDTRKPNYINIGGGKDKVVVGGKVTYSNTTTTKTKSDGLEVNNYSMNNGIIDYISDYNYTPDSDENLPDGVSLNSSYVSTSQSDILNYKYTYVDGTVGNDISLVEIITGSMIQPEISTKISDHIDIYNYTDTNLPPGVSIDDDDEYVYNSSIALNSELETYFSGTFNAYKSSSGAGLFITDNLIEKAGYIQVAEDMSGYVMRAPNIGSNTIKLDVNSLTLTPENGISVNNTLGIHGINHGIVVLERSVGSSLYPYVDSSFTLSVKQIDVSNILIRDSNQSTDNKQVINSEMLIQGDVALNSNLYVADKTVLNDDVSMNSNVFIGKDLIIDGNMSVKQYSADTIINTTTTNYFFIVAEDMSLNGRLFIRDDVSMNSRLYVKDEVIFDSDTSLNARLFVAYDVSLNSRLYVAENSIFEGDVSLNTRLFVADDVSLNGKLYVKESIGVGIQNPFVATDISFTDAIRIPRGTTSQRPNTTNTDYTHHGYIRYNIENQQFEGFGPGNSWGSLGGVINVAQNTKILASYPNADSINNELMFFTADTTSSNINDSTEQMRITSSGDVSMNNRLFVSDDVSFNRNLYVNESISVGGEALITGSGDANLYIGSGTRGSDTNASANNYIRLHSLFPTNSTDNSGNYFDFGPGDLQFRMNNATIQALYIRKSGEVGIRKVPSVGYNLDVTGTIRGDDLELYGGAYMGGNMGISGTSTMNGNVGIGMLPSTTNALDIFKNMSGVNVTSMALKASITDSGQAETGIRVGEKIITGAALEYIPLRVFSYGSERMRIDQDGRLKVNSTAMVGEVYNNNYLHFATAGGTSYAGSNASYIDFVHRANNNYRARIIGYGGTDATGSGILRFEAEKFTFVSGAVGINTETPSSGYYLDVNGAVQGASFNASSDRRLKTDIIGLPNALDLVNQLRGVSFQWKKTPGKKIFGVIAQEVEDIIPELVHTNETENEDGFKQKSIHYDGITPYLIEAIKTLTHQQTELKQEVETLKQENNLLKEKMDKYDALFEQLLNK